MKIKKRWVVLTVFALIIGAAAFYLNQDIPMVETPYYVANGNGGDPHGRNVVAVSWIHYTNHGEFTRGENNFASSFDTEEIVRLLSESTSRRANQINSYLSGDVMWELSLVQSLPNGDFKIIYIVLGKTDFWYETRVGGNRYYHMLDGDVVKAALERMLAEHTG